VLLHQHPETLMTLDNSPLRTTHTLHSADARSLAMIEAESIDLVVTSPPYPMIQMWDDLFSKLSPRASEALERGDGNAAFEAMHAELDKVWAQLFRVVRKGGFVCINIGDATRSINDHFSLYPNHARIISACTAAGFSCLPMILWSKTTNAPNKFMGSGMLPSGAYVTLEHEYIIILRKGSKRAFTSTDDKRIRMESAFFWEERNLWFSDVWKIAGVRQQFTSSEERERSAAYPHELAFRLVNMYSLYGDTVLDPFSGTGSTSIAALAAGRNSIGIEYDASLAENSIAQVKSSLPYARSLVSDRITNHASFVNIRRLAGKELKHHNQHLDTPVITAQEKMLRLHYPVSIIPSTPTQLSVAYEEHPVSVNNSDEKR